MKKNKILKILGITIVASLMLETTGFAHNKNENFKTKQNNTFLEKENIDGLNFKKVMDSFYFNQKNNINIICDNDSKNIENYGVEFNFVCPISSSDGAFHLIEHIINKIIKKITKLNEKIWAGLEEENLSYTDAHTSGNISKNCRVRFNFKDKFLKDKNGDEIEKIYKAISDVLLNLNNIDEKELKEIFEAEKSRVFLEMERKHNSKHLGDIMDIKILKYKKARGMYDCYGELDKIKKITFEKLKEYIKKYFLNAKPYVVIRCKTEKEAKKRVSLLNKYYFKNKKISNIPEEGKLKFENETFRKRIATDQETDIFVTYKNKKECIKKHVFEIEYNLEDLNVEEKMALFLLKEEYLKNLIDLKDLGYDDFNIFVSYDMTALTIRIYGDDENLFTKEKAKETTQKIKEKIINKIEKEKIEEKDLEIKKLEGIKSTSYEESIEKINSSLMKYKTPFSRKYFFVDKNTKKLKDKEEVMSTIKNCAEKHLGDIFKNILEKTPKVLHLIKPKNKAAKININNNENLTNLPYTYNLENIKNNLAVAFPIAEEKISKEIIKNEIHNKGLTYCYARARKSLDTYPDLEGLSKTEEKNIKEFFKSENFKNKLKNLKITDQELKELKEKYIKKANENIEQIKNNRNLQEKNLKALKEEHKKEAKDKTEKILSIINKIDLIGTRDLMEKSFIYLILNKEEYSEYKKLLNKFINIDKFRNEKFKSYHQNEKPKIKEEDLKKLLELAINTNENLITFEDKMLKKFDINKKDLNNLTKDMVNDVLKNCVVKNFDEVNIEKIKKDKKDENKNKNKN